MTDDNATDAQEKAPQPDSRPPKEQPSAGEPGHPDPATREQALTSLVSDASELSSVRFGKIISEGISRLAGVSTVNVFQGDFTVGGDFVSGAPTSRRSSAGRPTRVRLEPKELVERTEYFVPPPGFEQSVEMLTDNNLLILSGPAGTGRYTRAVATLYEAMRRTGRDPEVVKLTGSVLGNLTWRVPQRGCGLLVVDEPGKNGSCAAEKITDGWLSQAADRLAENESFLVAVTGPVRGALLTASLRAEFVLEDPELPDPLEIVRRRVSGEVPWVASDLDLRLSDAGLEEVLAERDDPGFATRAAVNLAEALRSPGETGLTEVVAKLSNPEDQVRAWLENDPDPAEIAFVLATAVLEGASYLYVADAAVALYRQLSTGTASLTPRYLRWLMAEYRWIELVDPQEDQGGPPALRFKQAHVRAVVLAMTWFELDGARTKILSWLKGLAEHSDVEVRARAAQAAGILADNDFEHGVHQYLLPWATARSKPLRQSAALGLNVAGALGGHAESAWSYVEQWADLVRSGNMRNLPATAGLAVGGPLGTRDPGRALRVLRTLVYDGNWALLEPIAMSTQTLLEAGRAAEVLDALLEWTEPVSTEEATVKALTMFAFAVSPEESSDDHPLLMDTARQHRSALPELWGRALANESARPLALDALRSWVRIADRDPAMRATVLDVIGGIADRSITDFDRLLHALRGWARDPNDPSDAAVDFYDQLVEAGEEA
ncbi:MAG TPA: hypothetical protein VJT49_28220 [Amycolatopsis sp.]|uniref:hypothetical protein n=1 Tax=Amycolatopsis sp. TaxID=37632 RepID=UPI002B4843DD|nr:hypothetical protein [Amycolatopsis sp.]HKS48924.1 hypothetical protein [Amycolatopsis sp.]